MGLTTMDARWLLKTDPVDLSSYNDVIITVVLLAYLLNSGPNMVWTFSVIGSFTYAFGCHWT